MQGIFITNFPWIWSILNLCFLNPTEFKFHWNRRQCSAINWLSVAFCSLGNISLQFSLNCELLNLFNLSQKLNINSRKFFNESPWRILQDSSWILQGISRKFFKYILWEYVNRQYKDLIKVQICNIISIDL